MKILTAAAKGLVTFLRSPLGQLAVSAGLMQVTGPIGPILQKWGANGLATFLGTWTGPDFTDADVDEHLSKMITVPVLDTATLFA